MQKSLQTIQILVALAGKFGFLQQGEG